MSASVREELERLIHEEEEIPDELRERIPASPYGVRVTLVQGLATCTVVEVNLDLAQELQSQAVTLETMALRHTRARQAQLALDQMNAGSYGICGVCQEPISAKRLHAITWAPRCVRCQDALERGEELPDLESVAAA